MQYKATVCGEVGPDRETSAPASSPPSSQATQAPPSSQTAPPTSSPQAAPASPQAAPPIAGPSYRSIAQVAAARQIPAEVFAQLELINRQLEMSEHSPMPPQPVIEIIDGWYAVYCGRYVGCFTSSDLVMSLTNGWPNNSSKKYSSFRDMYYAWKSGCMERRVHGKMSPHSLVPYIVSDAEAEERLHYLLAQMEDTSMSEDEGAPQTAATDATAAPAADNVPATTAVPDAPAAETVPDAPAAETAAPTATSNDAPAASTANDAPPAPTAAPFASGSTGSTSTPTPSCAAFAARVTPAPAAWVVVRGLRPGVYYDRDAYMAARGNSRAAWAFPAATVEAADALYIEHFPSSRTLSR
ncbi:hypothetical protein PsYK624_066040 [Phanerochaete sordida]|uniref:Uncharacterized protein n=1 Tax=Phanerochaete sordida TaxID=48140 RepID=A0A9P3G713_9APHY|nr:hypothetical protein PsYK624_066040 [Phanerochaete sordida]